MRSPLRPNVKDKLDVLMWDRLPEGPSDLNFRPPTLHGLDEPAGIGTLFVISFLAGAAGIIFREYGAIFLLSPTIALAALFAGGAIGLAVAAGLYRLTPHPTSGVSRMWDTLLGICSVPLLWLAIICVFLSQFLILALLLMLFVALPLIARTADRIATHFVYWQSANPRIDRQTMTGWRTDWDRRFSRLTDRPPCRDDLSSAEQKRVPIVMRLRRAYRRGFVWLAGCFCLMPVVGVLAILSGDTARLGLWMGGAMLAALLSLAGWRLMQAPCSYRLFWQALSSWENYDKYQRLHPTVFHSPIGSSLSRTSTSITTVACLSVALLAVVHAEPWFGGSSFGSGTSLLTDIVLPIAVVILASIVWPVVVYLLSIYVIVAPAIAAYHLALDAPDAYEQHDEWTELDGYAERLRTSSRDIERNSLLCGHNPTLGYPYLLDSELLFEHMHMLGATGIGKTALGLLTLITQLIRRNDGPVIVVDGKGDRALFNSVCVETDRAGRILKWLTNKPGLSTYVFNPFAQRNLRRLTLPEIIGLVTQSLNLHHGDDYGRAWFSIGSRVLMRAALMATLPHGSHYFRGAGRRRRRQAAPIKSFRDLEALFHEIVGDDEKTYQAAQHLMFLVQSLADFEQLNLSPSSNPDDPIVQHAIHMPDVISDKQVVYFFLTGMADLASVSEISRLALYSTLSAAMAYRDETGKKARVYFICDEAQTLIAQNIQNVLAQAREHGIACVLAHQTMSQLNPPGGVDLRELVMSCTTVKQVFSARDPGTMRYLSEISGSVPYLNLKWNQLKHRVVDQGMFGPEWACVDADGYKRIAVSEQVGYRLQTEDIQDINRDPNQSVFVVERGEGFSQYVGAFPMHTTWPISKIEHIRRNFDMPWPKESDETITLLPDWPEPTAETRIAQPQPDLNTLDTLIQQYLQDIRRHQDGTPGETP